MKVRKFLIAGGNSTALVYNCDTPARANVAKSLLRNIEQVGFVENSAQPTLTMMGGELCMNATIAFASTLNLGGYLKTSGVTNLVKYQNTDGATSLTLSMKYKQSGQFIIFEGIGYMISKESDAKAAKSDLREKCDEYNLPAFGQIVLQGSTITPFVYVKGVDSLVEETACGSGSIAASIASGREEIVQPSGKTISVLLGGNDLVTISARVEETT